MPGQAVTYKIGEIGIQEARKNRQKELGDKFDLKAFNRHVLTCLRHSYYEKSCRVIEFLLNWKNSPQFSGT